MRLASEGMAIMLDLQDVDKARLIKICDGPGKPDVGPEIDGYRVYEKVIVGHVRQPKYPNPHYKPEGREVPGYFIIDPYADRLYNGMDKKTWLKRLKGFGVNAEPELYRPSVFDAYKGRNRPVE